MSFIVLAAALTSAVVYAETRPGTPSVPMLVPKTAGALKAPVHQVPAAKPVPLTVDQRAGTVAKLKAVAPKIVLAGRSAFDVGTPSSPQAGGVDVTMWLPWEAKPNLQGGTTFNPTGTIMMVGIGRGNWLIDCTLVSDDGTPYDIQVGSENDAVTSSIAAQNGHVVFGASFDAAPSKNGLVITRSHGLYVWHGCHFDPLD
jgi:hypothetical protein